MTRTISWLLLTIATCLWSAGAIAQPYPSHPIKLIVPYPPGGNTDIVARIFSAEACRAAGAAGRGRQSRRRGGRAGDGGRGEVAQRRLHAGDRRPGLAGDRPAVQSQTSVTTRRRTWRRSALVTAVSIVVTVNPNSPDNTFADFLARAKAQPGKLTYGTGGVGGPGHLAFELLRSMTGVDILHVPFKGGAQAITGLLGEQVDIVVDGTAIAQVKAGRLKALAVTGPRLPALPDVPGIGETVEGLQLHQLVGLPRARRHTRRRDQAHQRGIDRDRRAARSARAAARPRPGGAEQHAAAVRRTDPHRNRKGQPHRQGRRHQARIAGNINALSAQTAPGLSLRTAGRYWTNAAQGDGS